MEKLTKHDFPNQTPVPDGYNMSTVPSLSLANFQVLVDKINELIDVVNQLEGENK
jgi:hypothetical protein